MMTILFAIIIIVCLYLIFKPIDTGSIKAKPQQIHSYEESVRRILEKIASDSLEAAEHGKSLFLTHGAKTKNAIIFYHGFTNCPRQYEILAKRFFDLGFNVYVPRVPHHGLADQSTKEIAKLTLEEILEVCDTSVDIARGLGEEITVLGLSMGGVMAAFNAQFRDDVERAVIIVPSFGWYFLPGVIRPLINFTALAPNLFMWWDPVKKDKRNCPFSMYHHFTTRQMGYILRLGLAILRAAQKEPPKTKKIMVMTNQIDIAVDEVSTRRLIRYWRKKGADIGFYRFSKKLKMEHDIIDPLHPYAKVDYVYDKIIEQMELK